MNFETWVLFILAVLALMSSPGPSHLLMLSNSATYGFKRATATIFGDLSANMLQMFAAVLGLSFLITTSSNIFNFIKWIGVTYLVWNALNMFFKKNNLKKVKKINSKKIFNKLYLQGYITSASNPKAIIFFASLFPQFIVIDQNIWIQFIILSLTYVTIDGISLTVVERQDRFCAEYSALTVHLIPETLRRTTIKKKEKNDQVNLEFNSMIKTIVDTTEGYLKNLAKTTATNITT